MKTFYLLIPVAGFFLAHLAGVNSDHFFLCRLYAEVSSTTCQQPVEDVTFISDGQLLESTPFGSGIYSLLLPCSSPAFLPPVTVSSPGFVSTSRQIAYGPLNRVFLDCTGNSCYPFETEVTVTSDCDETFDDLSVNCSSADCMVDRRQSGDTFLLRSCRRPVSVTVRERNHRTTVETINDNVMNIRITCSANINRVDGGWGKWRQTSSCSSTCGEDAQIARQRDCDSPRPQNGGRPCVGVNSDNIPCFSRSCPMDGHWSLWSQWTGCRATCSDVAGIAVFQTRLRVCGSPVPSSGGRPCPGSPLDTRQCDLAPCAEPVDGGWSPWINICRGFVSRTQREASDAPLRRKRVTSTLFRTCTNPEPMFGGADCVGPDSVTGYCQN